MQFFSATKRLYTQYTTNRVHLEHAVRAQQSSHRIGTLRTDVGVDNDDGDMRAHAFSAQTHTHGWRLSVNTNIVFLASNLIAALVHCGQIRVPHVAVRQTAQHTHIYTHSQHTRAMRAHAHKMNDMPVSPIACARDAHVCCRLIRQMVSCWHRVHTRVSLFNRSAERAATAIHMCECAQIFSLSLLAYM